MEEKGTGDAERKEKRLQIPRRQLPKLMACADKRSVDNMRNELLFHLPVLNADQLRRSKNPLHQCVIWELEEGGFVDSAAYLADLIDDNIQLKANDEIGVVVDLRKVPEYLERVQAGLRKAETFKSYGDPHNEVQTFLELADFFTDKGKGILWLAEKFFLAAIAVAETIMVDGGRLGSCSKYYYGKFLFDKFPQADTDESFDLLSQVRDQSIGKTWRLGDGSETNQKVFSAVATQLHRILLQNTRDIRGADPHRAERLCRMAERRAIDAEDMKLQAEAITELGISQLATNDLNNALKSFERALEIVLASQYIEGICEGHMHVASALQRLGDYDGVAKSLHTMGALSMHHRLRRQLGRALHLLGELYLRKGRPDIATPHLREAFSCFMGDVSGSLGAVFKEHDINEEEDNLEEAGQESSRFLEQTNQLELLHENKKEQSYLVEAEQSRLMMAISSGQEKMASYFKHLQEGGECAVARAKILDWKLHGDRWWVPRHSHDKVPCYCTAHNRSPLDVLRMEEEKTQLKSMASLDEWCPTTTVKYMHLPTAFGLVSETSAGVHDKEEEIINFD